MDAVFLNNPSMTMPPTLDYKAPGFPDEGTVALFGRDHGAGVCPCTLKLNFS